MATGEASPLRRRQAPGEHCAVNTTVPSAAEYDYRVFWSSEDGAFVATCAEFPSLSWLADSQTAALTGHHHLGGR